MEEKKESLEIRFKKKIENCIFRISKGNFENCSLKKIFGEIDFRIAFLIVWFSGHLKLKFSLLILIAASSFYFSMSSIEPRSKRCKE